MKPLISIVVPIYKVEKYLHRCVDSILGQTYKNLEIILVNDGSPDRCGDICNEYKEKDDRVIVIHKANGGLSDARNFGIERATGDFISFLDSDDWLHSDFVNRLHSLLTDKAADISACDFLKAYDDTAETPEVETEYPIFEFTNIEALEELEEDFGVQMVVAWGKLYKRELFNGVRYPKGRLHEDEFTTYKLLCAAGKIVYTPEPLLFYFQRNDSIMGQAFNIRNKLDFIEAIDERAVFLKQKGLDRLSDISYRIYFLSTLTYDRHIKTHHDQERVADLQRKKNSLLENLRAGTHSKKFRLFFELYFLAPRTSLFFFRIFEKYRLSRKRRS